MSCARGVCRKGDDCVQDEERHTGVCVRVRTADGALLNADANTQLAESGTAACLPYAIYLVATTWSTKIIESHGVTSQLHSPSLNQVTVGVTSIYSKLEGRRVTRRVSLYTSVG